MRTPVLLLLAVLLCGCPQQTEIPTPAPPAELTETIQYQSLPGVDPNLLSLDVYFDSGEDEVRPVVVYVHGGAWAVGDKANNISDKVALFRGENYVFVSLNYRLSPTEMGPNYADRVKFPVHNQDVATAVAWVADNIGRFGGDPQRIALLGHSAGAHLVSLTGTSPTFLTETGYATDLLRGVASIDTEGYDVAAQVADGNTVYVNAFGVDPAENRAASPIYNLSEGRSYPPFFVAQRGSARRLGIASAFTDRLRAVGAEVTVLETQTYDHEGINAAIGAAGETEVTGPLLAFFREVFGE